MNSDIFGSPNYQLFLQVLMIHLGEFNKLYSITPFPV